MVGPNTLFHRRKHSWPPEEFITKTTLQLVSLLSLFLSFFFCMKDSMLSKTNIGFWLLNIIFSYICSLISIVLLRHRTHGGGG